MRIKFLRDEQYESEGRNTGPKFAAGEVYDFTDEFGQRWVQRGAAELIDSDKVVTENTFKAVTRVATEAKPEAAPQPVIAQPPVAKAEVETTDTKGDPKPAERQRADPLKTTDAKRG